MLGPSTAFYAGLRGPAEQRRFRIILGQEKNPCVSTSAVWSRVPFVSLHPPRGCLRRPQRLPNARRTKCHQRRSSRHMITRPSLSSNHVRRLAQVHKSSTMQANSVSMIFAPRAASDYRDTACTGTRGCLDPRTAPHRRDVPCDGRRPAARCRAQPDRSRATDR